MKKKLIAPSLLVALFCLQCTVLNAQVVRYVKPVSTGAGNGSSWDDASSNLQAMINSSAAGDQVWVAGGTYGMAYRQMLYMKEGVKIYGGFAGTETALPQRDWVTNRSILQGNSATVIYNAWWYYITNAAVLDGFTIYRGSTFGASYGGMYNDRCSPTISNCTFLENAGSGMRNENSAPVITNCAFTNNSGLAGAGMYNIGSNPILTNCTFDGNNASGTDPSQHGGAGMLNIGSSPVLTGCRFAYNRASDVSGGAIYNLPSTTFPTVRSSPSLTNCEFQNNMAYTGGGISGYMSRATITNCVFTSNYANDNGGAIYNVQSAVTVSGCWFVYNRAVTSGAVYNRGDLPVFTNCVFTGNYASCCVSVMSNYDTYVAIRNCLFFGNRSQQPGGVIANLWGGTATLANCTIAGNIDGWPRMGVIYNRDGGSAIIDNSIIWGNSASIHNEPGGNTTVQYSIVQGGYAGTGNLDTDPLFIHLPAFGGAPFTDGDYRLSTCSPAINTGNDALLPANLTTDVRGKPRRMGGVIDRGSYETGHVPGPGNIVYVDSSVTPGRDGDSWSNAVHSLADALLMAKLNASDWTAANPLKIYVAKGVQKPLYRPDNPCGSNVNDRNNAFLLADNVQLYGGFDPANGIDDLSDARIFNSAGSILSGDIGAAGNNVDNAYHVIVSSGAVANVIVDGFTISGGNADGAGSVVVNGNTITGNHGGGIFHYASAPAYSNCTISGNRASGWGGGIYASLSPDFSISHSTVTANTASAGAGIFNDGCSPAITACSITNNNASFGAAIYNSGGAPVVINTSFSGNHSESYGGAVYNSGASASYTNCTFNNNSTLYNTAGGGAIFNNAATPVITNCRFTANSGDYGGGIYNYGASNPTVNGCTFTSNVGGMFGGAIYSDGASSHVVGNSRFLSNTSQFGGAIFGNGGATVWGSIFYDNRANSYGGAVYNNGSNVYKYTSCLFADNVSINGGGGGAGIFNNSSTTAVYNCTFRGNNSTFGAAIHNWATASSSISNSIIWGNSSAIYNESAASALVRYSIVQGGYAGTGNTAGDPLFVNASLPAGADGLWGTMDDGLRIRPCSPASNTGSNTYVLWDNTTDASATPRIQFADVDRGAYESNSLADNNASVLIATTGFAYAWQAPNARTYYAPDCSTLIASVAGNGTATAISGNTNAMVWVESGLFSGYVKRHFQIAPDANLSSATAMVTLYFRQTEFDDYNALNTIKLPQNPTDAAGIANVLIDRISGTTNNGTGYPGSYAGPTANINPNDANITWNATASRWEISFPVTGFGGFFLRARSGALPLKLVSFTAEEKNCIATVKWTTKDEVNVSGFEVEESKDGVSFTIVRKVAARNTMGENRYAINIPVPGNRMYYRLKMVDIDGTITYSEVIFVSASCNSRMQVFPNPASEKIYIRNAAIGSQYRVYDNAGKVVVAGNVSKLLQEVYIDRLSKGIYYMVVSGPDEAAMKIKFLKE